MVKLLGVRLNSYWWEATVLTSLTQEKHMFANHDVSRPVSKTYYIYIYHFKTTYTYIYMCNSTSVAQWVCSAGSRVSDNMSI